MRTKSAVLLALLLAAFGIAWFFLSSRPSPKAPDLATNPPAAQENIPTKTDSSLSSASNPGTSQGPATAQLPEKGKLSLPRLLEEAKAQVQKCRNDLQEAKRALSVASSDTESLRPLVRQLGQISLLPPATQSILAIIESEKPENQEIAAFVHEIGTAGGCDVIGHYDELNELIDRVQKRGNLNDLKPEILGGAQAFLTQGVDSPAPVLVYVIRLSLLEKLAKLTWIDGAHLARIQNARAEAANLKQLLALDLKQCEGQTSCTKAYLSEIEAARKLRALYQDLIGQIWQ